MALGDYNFSGFPGETRKSCVHSEGLCLNVSIDFSEFLRGKPGKVNCHIKA